QASLRQLVPALDEPAPSPRRVHRRRFQVGLRVHALHRAVVPAAYIPGAPSMTTAATRRRSSVHRTLHSCPAFAGIDDEALARIAQAATRVTVRAGDVLMEQGEIADAAYVVVTGRLRASVVDDGREVSIAERGRGEIIGELAL